MKSLIFLLLFVFLIACSEKKDTQKFVLLEFRIAETESTDSQTKMIVTDWGEVYYLRKEVEITNKDVKSAEVKNMNDRTVILLTFNEEGKQKFADLTANNIGKKIGMLLDGKLVSAPVVNDTIKEGRAIISYNFNEEEAESIAKSILLKN
ncbi:hypothetical protein ACFLS9_06875 [Bacteroidota bacterium]